MATHIKDCPQDGFRLSCRACTEEATKPDLEKEAQEYRERMAMFEEMLATPYPHHRMCDRDPASRGTRMCAGCLHNYVYPNGNVVDEKMLAECKEYALLDVLPPEEREKRKQRLYEAWEAEHGSVDIDETALMV